MVPGVLLRASHLEDRAPFPEGAQFRWPSWGSFLLRNVDPHRKQHYPPKPAIPCGNVEDTLLMSADGKTVPLSHLGPRPFLRGLWLLEVCPDSLRCAHPALGALSESDTPSSSERPLASRQPGPLPSAAVVTSVTAA